MNGNKFSVVIPTMWYSPQIHRNLPNLEDCNEVGEIILIDNNPSLKPSYLDNLKKLKYLPQQHNIFVNPAWNLGVKESQYKNICISNDDVLFNNNIFSFVQQHIEKGIIGMSTGNYYGENDTEPYEIQPIEWRPWGWGCLFFLHKNNWVNIDERLKIACGDDWLLHHVKGGGFEIKNFNLGNDNISQTSIRSEFFQQQKKDIELWSQYSH